MPQNYTKNFKPHHKKAKKFVYVEEKE